MILICPRTKRIAPNSKCEITATTTDPKLGKVVTKVFKCSGCKGYHYFEAVNGAQLKPINPDKSQLHKELTQEELDALPEE